MGAPYHQFCPVAKAMELLDERWTLLVVRELLLGGRRFNDLRRGVPRMSPTLLSKRLHELVAAGLVERRSAGKEVTYRLSPAGEELRPVVEALGAWGIRWMGHLGDQDLDPKLLLWDMHRNVDHALVPAPRAVVYFRFPDVAPRTRHWWLVITPQDADVCDEDPGHDVDVSVEAPLRCMVQIWLGDLTWANALRSGDVRLVGPTQLCRALPGWFTLSPFAAVPRPTLQPREPESLTASARI
ncbi:MAG: winged helix-turn-helix transcriptional regulator [Kineosporiaceae bacterium]